MIFPGRRRQHSLASFILALGFSITICLASSVAQAGTDPSAPVAATPATPSTAPASPASPTSKTPPAAPGGESNGNAPGVPSDAAAQSVDVAAKPTAVISGKAKWGDGFATIMDATTALRAAVDKAGLKAAGHPLAVFTETDDAGFSYQAMLPLAEKPEGKTELSDTVKLGSSPSGKAIKFQHHGPYDDIDSTYDLITAYLDEKGLEAQDHFVEEYMTELKNADDPNLAVDIYVFVK